MGFGSFVKSVGGAVVSPVSGVVDGVTDAVGDVVDVAADMASEVVATTAGASSWIVDGATHVVTPIASAVLNTTIESFDLTYSATKYIGARGMEMVGEGTALVGPAIELAGDVGEVATLGLGDDLLDAVDDHVLDTIDEATGGVVNIDYDGGGFSVDVGIDDVIGIGVSIGEDGVSSDSEVFGGSLGMGMGDDGLLLDAEAGIDEFPLPYLSGHVEVDADGNVDVNGVVQGPYPYPVGDGILAGRVEGGFQRTDEGWMVGGEAEAVWVGFDGTQISGQAGAAYGENEDGSMFSVNAAGSITSEFGTAGGGVGYSRIDQDGVVIETFEAEAHGSGFGMEAGAAAKYMGIETPEGSESVWETDVGVSGVNAERLTALGAEVLGDGDGAEVLESDDLLGIDLPEDPVVPTMRAVSGLDGESTSGEPNFVDPVPEVPTFGEPIDDAEPVDQEFVAEEIPALVEDSTEFDESIEAADVLEDSMDDLFEGLD